MKIFNKIEKWYLENHDFNLKWNRAELNGIWAWAFYANSAMWFIVWILAIINGILEVF